MRAHAAVASPLLALLALLVALAPTAAAHAPAFEGTESVGELEVHARLDGPPLPAAQSPLVLRVALSGAPADSITDVGAILAPTGTDTSAAQPFALEPQKDGANASTARWFFASTLAPTSGPWTMHILTDGREVAAFEFDVLPAGNAFLDWATADDAIVHEGESARPLVQLVDAERRPLAMPADATARVVADDGSGAGADAEAQPIRQVRLDEGRLAVEGLPPGPYFVHVSAPSLGLDPGERPALRLLVVPPEDAAVYEAPQANDTPGPATAWTLGAMLAAAGAVALLRGRRAQRNR